MRLERINLFGQIAPPLPLTVLPYRESELNR